MVARVFERQLRGVLHVHVVLAYTSPRQRAIARHYVNELARLADRYEFGYVDRKLEPVGNDRAAAYLSGYFVKGKGKLKLTESVMHVDMPRSIIHVSTRLTLQTGCTIRRLRFHRYVWTRWRSQVLCPGDTWHELDRYVASDTGVRLARANAPPTVAHEGGPSTA